MPLQIGDAHVWHAGVAHEVAQPSAHLAHLDAVDDDAEALEVQKVLGGLGAKVYARVEALEVGVVGPKVGDERLHLVRVAEAQEGYETHERLQQRRMHAHEGALDVAQQKLELLGVATERGELTVDAGRLLARLHQQALHDGEQLRGQTLADLARLGLLHLEHHVERLQHGHDRLGLGSDEHLVRWRRKEQRN